MRIDKKNVGAPILKQTIRTGQINGYFNNRSVRQIYVSKNTISQNTSPQKGFYKKLNDFSISAYQAPNKIKEEFYSKKVKKQAVNSLINNGYTPKDAKYITLRIANTVQSKKEFFATINDYPTAKQYQQGYISKFQVDNDLTKALNHAQQLGYISNKKTMHILQDAQQRTLHRNSFLQYVENMPTVADANKGYTSKLQVASDVKWATELFEKLGYNHKNAEHYAKQLQIQSLNKHSFVYMINNISFTHKLKSWSENTLIDKGYSKAEATEIFNNLAQQTPDYNNLINVINTMRTKEQASTGTSFHDYSPEEQDKLKQEALEVLKLTKDATPKEISKAYKKLALQYHPDKNPVAEAKEMFTKIQQAYEFLTK